MVVTQIGPCWYVELAEKAAYQQSRANACWAWCWRLRLNHIELLCRLGLPVNKNKFGGEDAVAGDARQCWSTIHII